MTRDASQNLFLPHFNDVMGVVTTVLVLSVSICYMEKVRESYFICLK